MHIYVYVLKVLYHHNLQYRTLSCCTVLIIHDINYGNCVVKRLFVHLQLLAIPNSDVRRLAWQYLWYLSHHLGLRILRKIDEVFFIYVVCIIFHGWSVCGAYARVHYRNDDDFLSDLQRAADIYGPAAFIANIQL